MHDKVLALLHVYLETVLLQICLVFFFYFNNLPTISSEVKYCNKLTKS